MNKLTIRSLVAAAVASLALVAVGPANAETKPPTDENGKKGCLWNTDPSKGDTWVKHDTVITVQVPDGPKMTYRCNDGDWEEVKKRTIGGAVINLGTGTVSISDGGGTLVVTQPKIDSGAITPPINPVIAP